jgi:hypothetical protein
MKEIKFRQEKFRGPLMQIALNKMDKISVNEVGIQVFIQGETEMYNL